MDAVFVAIVAIGGVAATAGSLLKRRANLHTGSTTVTIHKPGDGTETFRVPEPVADHVRDLLEAESKPRQAKAITTAVV